MDGGEIRPGCRGCMYVDDTDCFIRGACLYILYTGRSRVKEGIAEEVKCSVKRRRAESVKMMEKRKTHVQGGKKGKRVSRVMRDTALCYDILDMLHAGRKPYDIAAATQVGHNTVERIKTGERYGEIRAAWKRERGYDL